MSDSPLTPGDAPASHPHGDEPLPEGEETAPPGTRTMALVRWGLVALMAVAAAGAWVYYADLVPRTAKSAVQYRCPMHPSVIADSPGQCPICGMDLVPAGEATRPGAASAQAGPGKYWCPMHPEVHSDDPNAVCEKCGGMRLVPRDAASPPGAQGVPGLAAVDLTPERIQLIGVRTAAVAREKLAPSLRTVGIVTADEGALVVVAPRFSGWVEEVLASQSGQRVQKGEALARLYSPELVTAQLNYVNAIRWLDEHPESADTAQNLERDARARLQLLGVDDRDIDELRRTRKALRALSLRTPISGYVGKKSAVVGLYVQPGTELFEIADLSTVWVIADVYEYEIERVKIGQRATISVPANPGQQFTGRVSFLYPSVNPISRTMQARLEFKNPALRLRPGMYADVRLDLGAVEGLVISSEALVDTGESQYVFVSREGGRFEPRRVRTGARGDGKVELLEGVAEGEKVVTTANFLVDSESRLRAAIEGMSSPAAGPPGHSGHAPGPDQEKGQAAAPAREKPPGAVEPGQSGHR
ncbi:MAG TPA: efflux RND transporter periplasmic adaptor subunit [Anaeromyxobacteraceae bacterium]|nr:efflux RND transporter periplasmic adaptor subunit [Anaeromyxobacteraceae bacterium]